MELVLTEEQRLLRDSAQGLAARIAGPDAHRASRGMKGGIDRDRLAALAEAGWLSLTAPANAGGLGLGMTEYALVLEEAGRGLVREPAGALGIAAHALAAGRAAQGLGGALEELLAGKRIILPAIRDPECGTEPDEEITAFEEHYGYELNGRRRAVPQAAAADAFLIDARTGEGTVLCVVPAEAAGVRLSLAETVDGSGAGTLELASFHLVADRLVEGKRNGGRLTAALYDRLVLGGCAEMLGVMEQAFALATGYMAVREQFGRPIGGFQALQHLAVDDHVEIELTRSLLYQVAAALDRGHGDRAMVAAVAARACEAVLTVTKSAIQLHGAIGFTDEHDVGLYLRRAMALAVGYGSAASHRARFASLSAAQEAAEADGDTRTRSHGRRRTRRKRQPASPFR